MAIHLHLFSTPGDRDLSYIVDACRPYLAERDEPLVAYMPLANLSNNMQDYTERSFKGLARVATINSETMTSAEMENILRDAHVVYIPGGNTFLLSHRLNNSRMLPYLRKKILAGLPVAAFSAGTILCGANILTSSDMNMIETPHFAGLNLVPFNFAAHYEDDVYRDEWLSDYHVFQNNPVILLADGSYVRVEGKKCSLARGEAWILRRGQEKEKLKPGNEIVL